MAVDNGDAPLPSFSGRFINSRKDTRPIVENLLDKSHNLLK
jgi:hypothetical protein